MTTKTCPECNSDNYQSISDTLKICLDCDQDWWTDIDYEPSEADQGLIPIPDGYNEA